MKVPPDMLRKGCRTLMVACAASLLAPLTASAATYWVSVSGTNTNPGTQAQPFRTVTYAMTQALSPGDIVNVTSGTYRNEKIEFKASGTTGSPITLQAAPGENPIVRGSIEVTNWTLDDPASQSRPIYSAPWTYYFGAWDSRFTTDPQGNLDNLFAGHMARNQFFVNGTYLPEVPRIIDLAPNTFYIDDAADKVYVWLADSSTPVGKLVEGTNTQDALIATRANDHLVIRGFTVEHCANTGSLNAMVRADATGSPSNNWSHYVLIENITGRFAAGTAIGTWACNPVTIRNCILTDNGQSGLLIAGVKNSLVSGGQWLRNNTLFPKTYNHGIEAVGKIASCEDTIVENIESAYNRGFGMWVDGPRNRRITLRNNKIHRNSVSGAVTSGVRLEICYLVDFYNNVVYRNDSGLSIDTSIGCRVFNNTFAYNTSEGIYCAGVRTQWDDIREDAVMRNYGNKIYNNILAFNQQGNNKRGYINSYNVPDPSFNPPEYANSNGVVPFAQNESNNNLFHKRSGASADFFVLHTDSPWANTNYTSLTAWQAASSGQSWDTNSKWQQDPLFVNAAADDFRIQAGSPAIGMGVLLSGIPNEALVDPNGVARSTASIDAGAYQFIDEVGHTVHADTYVENGGNANANYGTLTRLNAELKASTIRKTYMRFNIASTTKPIRNGSIELYTNASASPTTFQVYGLNNGATGDAASAWLESGTGSITWNNAPANSTGNTPDSNATYLGTFTLPAGTATGSLVEFSSLDLDTFLNADTNDWLTFILIRTTNSTSFNNTFHPKETTTSGVAGPMLITR